MKRLEKLIQEGEIFMFQGFFFYFVRDKTVTIHISYESTQQ